MMVRGPHRRLPSPSADTSSVGPSEVFGREGVALAAVLAEGRRCTAVPCRDAGGCGNSKAGFGEGAPPRLALVPAVRSHRHRLRLRLPR